MQTKAQKKAQNVYIGRNCMKKVERAGIDGYRPPKGGPKLFKRV